VALPDPVDQQGPEHHDDRDVDQRVPRVAGVAQRPVARQEVAQRRPDHDQHQPADREQPPLAPAGPARLPDAEVAGQPWPGGQPESDDQEVLDIGQ
jgi:hypothetical protein